MALAARRRTLVGATRANTGTALARLWSSMPDHAAVNQSAFAKQALPVVRAGQDKAISVNVAYIKSVTGIQPVVDRGALFEQTSVDLSSPFLAFGAALNAGLSVLDALTSGEDDARITGEDAVQWAARQSGSAFDHSEQITGWERIPDGAACDWCVLVAGQTYRTADTAAFGHSSCACDVGPLTDDRPQGYEASAALYAASKG